MTLNRFRALAALVTICLCATFALSQTTTKRVHQGPGDHMLSFYTDYLDLTDAQQTQIKAILTKEKATLQPLTQQLGQTHAQLRQLEEGPTFDEAKVRALASQQSQSMIDLVVEKARMKNEMIQVLTADQKAKLQKMEARREQRFLKHMDGPPATE